MNSRHRKLVLVLLTLVGSTLIWAGCAGMAEPVHRSTFCFVWQAIVFFDDTLPANRYALFSVPLSMAPPFASPFIQES